MARVGLSEIFSIEQIDAIASKLLQLTREKIWCFYGDLGAGKTTLIRALAPLMASIQPMDISSPTFIYLHEYETLCHFDLYRLQSAAEFEKMGFEECFSKTCLIEWAENIEEILPKNRVEIRLEIVDENRRKIEMRIYGSKTAQVS